MRQKRSDLPQEIRAFFDQYRDAFNRLDAGAIAALYSKPSGIAQDGTYTHWNEYEPIWKNMEALCQVYRDKGFESAQFVPNAFIDQGSQYAIADLNWTIDWSGPDEPWHFKTTYNLVRTAKGWRILLCTAYTEGELHSKKSDA